jgi:hypothetical protein
MSQLWDIRQSVRTLVEDIVTIRYHETTSVLQLECLESGCYNYLCNLSINPFTSPNPVYSHSFLLWLYSPILGLGRLHETFRFISVTRSRTVGRTPWTGDQLVARPLLTAPGDCDDGEVGGMNGFGRGNRSTRRKTVPTPLCPPQILLARLVSANPDRRGGKPATNRFSYVAAL